MDSLPDQFDDDGGYSHYPDPEDLPQFTWPLVPAPQNEVYGLDEIRYDDYSPEYGSEESTGLPDDTPLGFPRDDSSNDPDFLEGDFDSDEIEESEAPVHIRHNSLTVGCSEESMSDEESAEDNSIPRGMRSRVYKRKQGQPFNLDAIKARKTKTGYRKPLEPTQRFKDTLAHATAAFLAGDYDRAYGAIQQAIAINPEIYSAHSLLSEIHLARGDKIEASVALFQAAHTKCRDPEIWMRLAGLISETSTEGRESTVSDMIYCYSRVISYKADHFEARLKRATLLRERGQAAKALLDYLKLRRGDFQFDTTLLRYLAETYSELNEHHMAIELYDDTIIHLQSMGTSDFISLGWSDMNIYAELFIHAKEPQEGLFKLKGAARWLLQREDETFWVEFAEDDREFDKHDHPRRSMVPEFIPNVHPASSYGDGLPLELRIKLGLLRLLQGGTHVNEAMVSIYKSS